jgi:hypothetical protein
MPGLSHRTPVPPTAVANVPKLHYEPLEVKAEQQHKAEQGQPGAGSSGAAGALPLLSAEALRAAAEAGMLQLGSYAQGEDGFGSDSDSSDSDSSEHEIDMGAVVQHLSQEYHTQQQQAQPGQLGQEVKQEPITWRSMPRPAAPTAAAAAAAADP